MALPASPCQASGLSRLLPIISADQRLAEPRGIKGTIFGKSGIGKTSLLWTLDPATTLFIDLEAGDLAIEGWSGDSVRPRTWAECRDFAVFIGGPNPALRDDQVYSEAHFAAVCERFGDPAALDRYHTVFIDSITVAGRLCFQWCKGQPEAFSEKTGKPDVRGAYPRSGFMHIDLGPARQWGERFPVQATGFAAETAPAREVLADSRTMKGSGAAGAATLGAVGVEVAQSVLTETQSAILPLVPYLDTLRWVFIAVALGGIAVTIYARIDDWRRGRR